MLAFATNQIIARKLSGMGNVSDNKKRGLAQNAQVGTVTLLACSLMVLVLGFETLVPIASSSSLLIGSIFVGLWVVAIIVSGLMAYARGANIALMRVVATATFLFGSALAGWLIFGEAFGLSKVVAFLLFVAAFVLISRDRG